MLFERRPAARFAEDDGQFVPLADPVFLDDTVLTCGVIAVLAAAADSPVVWDHAAAGSLLLLNNRSMLRWPRSKESASLGAAIERQDRRVIPDPAQLPPPRAGFLCLALCASWVRLWVATRHIKATY